MSRTPFITDATGADVIDLFTGEPWVPDVPIERIDEKDEAGLVTIDDNAIKQVEYLLQDLKEGKCVGLGALTWDREMRDFKMIAVLPPRVNEIQASLMFSGGIDFLKSDFQELADLSSGRSTTIVEMEYDGDMPS